LQKFGESDLQLSALQACVGPAAGIELDAFARNLDKLPDLDAVLKGEPVPIPREVDLQYAVASALVGRALRAKGKSEAKEVYGAILNFAGRFPDREMGVMLVSDMHRAIGQAIFSVPEFAPWAKAVADVMLYA
jgi:hypothetical protein